MLNTVNIESAMTKCPHTIGKDQDILLARRMMYEFDVSHLPVQEGGKLVGVISDRDIKYATGWTKSKPGQLEVQDVYTPEPYIVEPSENLRTVLLRMIKDHIGCTLVAENKDKLVGIFTVTDACKHLATLLAKKEYCETDLNIEKEYDENLVTTGKY